MDQAKRNRTLTIVLFIIYLLLLTWIVLFKLHVSFADMEIARNINLVPFLGSDGIDANIIYNIVFFIPFGVYLCMLKREWNFIKKLLPVLCASLAFEILQYALAIGRTDVTDLICNVLGGIAGIGIYALLFKMLKNKTNKVINIAALALTICAIVFFALLVTDSLPLMIRL